jgi:hypothetical protein
MAGDGTRRGRWRRRAIWAAVAALVAVAWFNPDRLVGWLMLKDEGLHVELAPDPVYEATIPRYVELCATSQWRKADIGVGGPFGHATLYLKGACMDESAPFPQLRRCRRVATGVDDPEHGAGVSVGRWFRNVNWIGTPSHALFYDGDLEPGERLTPAHFADTVKKVIDLGMLRGVELHDGWTREADRSLGTFVAQNVLATDTALRYGRTLFCARVPVTEAGLDEVIAFLNDKNREFATGAYDYNWALLSDNCVHTIRNAFAAALFWPPMSVGEIWVRHLFNPATPANEFVNLALAGGAGPWADPAAIADDPPRAEALFDQGWLPTRPGALVKVLPVHADNDLFDPTFRLFAVQSPLRMGATAATLDMLSDPRFTDIEANLTHWAAAYREAIAAREAAARGLATVRGDPLRRLDRRHLDYLRAERAETDRLLAAVRALKAADPAPSPAPTAAAGG